MNLSFFNQFNWLDIFVVILLLRTTYCAIKNGVFVELFKLSGALFSCYISLHYYTKLSDVLTRGAAFTSKLSLEVVDFFSVSLLAVFAYLIFVILRETFFRFIKAETVSTINRWGATALGLWRGVILSSLIIFLLSIPVFSYFGDSVKGSFSGKRMIKVSTGTYMFLFNTVASKFMPSQKINQAVLEIQKGIIGKQEK